MSASLQQTTQNYMKLFQNENKSFVELQQEPQRLQEHCGQLKSQLLNSCVDEYDHFLATQQALTETNTQLSELTEQLSQLSSQILPKFQQDALHFMQTVAPEIKRERTRIKQCSTLYDSIAQLLEIPQLAENCIQNELYSEALDLEEFTRKLARNHVASALLENNSNNDAGAAIVTTQPNITSSTLILEQLAQETSTIVLNSVMRKLLVHLRSAINVPMCLKMLTHLRRLNVLSERELRILFLQSRCSYVQHQVIASVPRKSMSPYQYLSQVTDILKLQVFEMVTQYQALFPNTAVLSSSSSIAAHVGSPSSSGSSPSIMNSPSATLSLDAAVEAKKGAQAAESIVSVCITHLIYPYIELLKQDLQRITSGEEINNLMKQCLYCGQTLARIGADFRGLLVPLFVQRVRQMFEQQLNDAIDTFCKHNEHSFKWCEYKIPSISSHQQLQQQQLEGNPFAPPRSLLAFPQLAEFTNDLLRALNELRLCAPLQLYPQLNKILLDKLQSVVERTQQVNYMQLATGSGAILQELESTGKQNHKEMMKLLPIANAHVQKCFSRIFTSSQ